MREVKFVIILFLILPTEIYSQHNTFRPFGTISGTIIDSPINIGLQDACILLLGQKDTSLRTLTWTDKKGDFHLSNISEGNYNLIITFVGYQTVIREIHLSPKESSIDLGIIYLTVAPQKLKEVIINSPPVLFRKDTIEYRADQFHTRPNSNLAQLLQKLPGMEVDQSGNLHFNGEAIQRIMVDGKLFFVGDPIQGARILPRDIIDKIQAFDDKSEQSKFTGVGDGVRIKTINVILKKDRRIGIFGKAEVGAGDEGLYNVSGSINTFGKDTKLSLIGSASNINLLGTGLATNRQVVANFNEDWSKSIQMNIGGSSKYTSTTAIQQTIRENIFPGDTSIFNNVNSSEITQSTLRTIHINLILMPDSINKIGIQAALSSGQTIDKSANNSLNIRGMTSLSSTMVNNSSNSNNSNYSINSFWGHQFAGNERSLMVTVSSNVNSGNRLTMNQTTGNYMIGSNDSVSTNDQAITGKTNLNGFSGSISYSAAIGKYMKFQFTGYSDFGRYDAGQAAFGYDSLTGKYSTPDSLLTNRYKTRINTKNLAFRYNYQKGIFEGVFSLTDQWSKQSNESIPSHAIAIRQNYSNLIPQVDLTCRPSSKMSVTLAYFYQPQLPDILQLQPILNNLDPLHITIGNPGLKQSISNTFFLQFKRIGDKGKKNLFGTIKANFISDAIAPFTKTILSSGADSSYPINLNGAFQINGTFNYTMVLGKPSSTLGFISSFLLKRAVSINATIDTAGSPLMHFFYAQTNNCVFKETINWESNFQKSLDFRLSCSPALNIIRNTVSTLQNIQYFNFNLFADLLYYTERGWTYETSFNYNYNGGTPYNSVTPILNTAVSHLLFRHKQGEIKLSVVDLLNRNTGVSRIIGQNFILDSRINLQKRYFQLSVIYNLKDLHG